MWRRRDADYEDEAGEYLEEGQDKEKDEGEDPVTDDEEMEMTKRSLNVMNMIMEMNMMTKSMQLTIMKMSAL